MSPFAPKKGQARQESLHDISASSWNKSVIVCTARGVEVSKTQTDIKFPS
jgi:hypothetical protein